MNEGIFRVGGHSTTTWTRRGEGGQWKVHGGSRYFKILVQSADRYCVSTAIVRVL